MRFWFPALVLVAALPAGAHHPFTPYYDASRPASVTGIVAELRVGNPHVVVIIDAQGPDGRAGRWAFEGYPPNAFVRQGVTDLAERLRAGTKITISGWPARNPNARAFSGRDVTFADGSTLRFGPAPEEADRWRCEPAPCAYSYPDVLPR
jgi:hypothetical protein